MIKRVACYVRVSTENQLENYSIEEQIERLRAYCKAKDWNIYKIYTDGGYSGGNLNRPALSQMLNDIDKRKIDMVVVYKLDRLSRSQKDTLTLIEDSFISNNVDFVSVSENFDTSTPFGRAMIGILSVFAQLEKDQITERFTMGRIGRSKAGYYHGGPTPPTGYNYVDGKLIIDDYKSLQVKEVFERFLKGESINSIRRNMQQKYGGWNSHSHVINVLKNSTYIAKVKFNKQEHDGIHEPIIDVDTFTKVQQLFHSVDRENSKNAAQKSPFKACNLLSSLIICKKCGARYSGSHGYYKCYSRSKNSKKYVKDPNCKNKNWGIDELNKIVVNEIIELKYNSAHLDDLFSTIKDTTQEDNTIIRERLMQVDAQISKMIDLYQINEIPIEQISERISSLQSDKEKLQQQLNASPADKKESISNFIELINKSEKILKDGSLEEKRLFVSSIIKQISIDDDDVNIVWRI